MGQTLQDKIKVLKDFKETFSNQAVSLYNGTIINALSVDEVLSADFEKLTDFLNFSWSVNYELQDSLESKFVKVFSSSNKDKFMNELTQEERYTIYDSFLARQKLSNIKVFGNNVVAKDIDYSEYLKKMISLDILDLYAYSNMDFVTKAADLIMITGTLEDIELIRDTFKKHPTLSKVYANYPLVITNKNLERKDKIEIIKKNYRKKDLNKYTDVIREFLTNFNDLDDFIEATILQNNRVRKEEAGFIDLIRRVFIGMRGEYFHVTDKIESCSNRKEFVTKYREYFTTENVTKLVGSSSYNSQRNVVAFFKVLFKDQPFKYKMRVALGSKSVGQGLFSGLFDMPKEVIGVEEEERLFYKFIVEHNLLEDIFEHDFKTTIKYLNKFPEIFSKNFRTEFNFEGSTGYYSNDAFDNKNALTKRILSQITEENISKFSVFSEDYFNVLGLVDDESRWGRGERAAIKFKNFIEILLPFFTDINNNNPIFKEYLYTKYFSKLADDDFMNDFVTHTSIILNDNKAGKEFVDKLREPNLIAVFKRMFGKLAKFMEVNYPEAIDAFENVEQARDELIIICIL